MMTADLSVSPRCIVIIDSLVKFYLNHYLCPVLLVDICHKHTRNHNQTRSSMLELRYKFNPLDSTELT